MTVIYEKHKKKIVTNFKAFAIYCRIFDKTTGLPQQIINKSTWSTGHVTIPPCVHSMCPVLQAAFF